MAAVVLRCPRCQQPLEIPAVIVAADHARGTVAMRIDQSVAKAHLEACTPQAVEAPGPSQAELAGRVNLMLNKGAYIATGGSRACTMCGAKGQACLDQLSAKHGKDDAGNPVGVACCPACSAGNTHPAPKDTLACAEWAVEHHGAQQ